MVPKWNTSNLVKLIKMTDEVTTFKGIQPTFVAIIGIKKHVWLKGNIF